MTDGAGDDRDDVPSERELQDDFTREFLADEQGEHPRLSVTRVHVRIGRQFVSIWWFLPALLLGGVATVVAFKLLAATGTGRSFVAAHRCIPSGRLVQDGVPYFVIATHVFNFFLLVMVVRAGLQILADHPRLYTQIHCTPGREWLRFRGPVPTDRVWTSKDDAITLTPLVGLPGGRHTIGVARHWHFLADILFVLNGVVYVVLIFVTGYWHKIVPTSTSIVPRAASCLITYSSLHLPAGASGYYHYDALQQLS